MDHLIKEFDNSLMKLLRIKVVKKGLDKVKNQNVLYVANHTSNFDLLIMSNAIP
jgi:1-acyl-sn-glycerol-3-phosphate acyltransferase